MVWNASNLKLNSVEPSAAKAGSTTELTVGGEGFRAGMQLLLVQDVSQPKGNGIVPSLELNLTNADQQAKARVNLELVAPGSYTVAVWNPPAQGTEGNEVATLDGSLSITE